MAGRTGRRSDSPIPLAVYLRRRRRRRWAVGVAVAAGLLIGAGLADRERARLAELARVELKVVEVVDAATLRVAPANPADAEEEAVAVRLAGVDVSGRWAAACGAVLQEHAAGRPVRLSWRERLPRSGGEAYVYLADGRLLNAWLIEHGHARAATGRRRLASTHYLGDWFSRLESRAAGAERGFWAELAED